MLGAMAPRPSKCRLFVLLARKAPRAVIFRRGPSAQVGLYLWHLDTDRIEPGQWLKGRIYERRCDLSPDGKHLVYFCAQWRKPMQTWTAISRPPWLTALALWPKGDAWGGGGLWDDDASIAVSHAPSPITPMEGSVLPRKVKVRELGLGHGEDAPIWSERMRREGWRCTVRGKSGAPDFGESPVWKLDPPNEWEKASPTDRARVLTMRVHAVAERSGRDSEGDWYVIDHVVRESGARGRVTELALGRSEWADWAPSGDLLFAQGGVLHRLPRRFGLEREKARVVADLRADRFVARRAPKEARVW
jgi:hypothetical protein